MFGTEGGGEGRKGGVHVFGTVCDPALRSRKPLPIIYKFIILNTQEIVVLSDFLCCAIFGVDSGNMERGRLASRICFHLCGYLMMAVVFVVAVITLLLNCSMY